MAMVNIMPNENPPLQLVVYDLQMLKSALYQRLKTEDGVFQALLTDLAQQVFGSFTNGETRSDTLTHICASGLTAKEVINRIADIADRELRKKLGAAMTAYIMSRSSNELQKAFEIDFDFDQLDDTKGNINVQEQTANSQSSTRKLNVYYAKCLICRKDNKYDLNVAFYNFVSTIPVYAITAYFKSNEVRSIDLEMAKATAFNTLHRQLKAAWPDKIVLEERSTLPSET